jgi:DNA primase
VFVDRLERALSFLEFQVQTVIERANLSSSAGKDRALADLKPIFAAAEPSAERDEQLRFVADRLDLPEHLLAPLMERPATARSPEAGQGRLRGAAQQAERWERIFLAMCVSAGERGRDYLERLSDDHLSSNVLERARKWILEHFDAPTIGLAQGDEELAQAVGEIVIRASGQPAGEQALQVGFLGLERRRLEREIKAAGEAQEFERQHELSRRRNETTEAIVRLMGGEEIDPAHSRSPSITPQGNGGDRS